MTIDSSDIFKCCIFAHVQVCLYIYVENENLWTIPRVMGGISICPVPKPDLMPNSEGNVNLGWCIQCGLLTTHLNFKKDFLYYILYEECISIYRLGGRVKTSIMILGSILGYFSLLICPIAPLWTAFVSQNGPWKCILSKDVNIFHIYRFILRRLSKISVSGQFEGS